MAGKHRQASPSKAAAVGALIAAILGAAQAPERPAEPENQQPKASR